jgi:ferredoxin
MTDALLEEARALLAEGKVSGILALRREGEEALPHVFASADELKDWTPGVKWPLAKTVWRMLKDGPSGKPLGVICRACDSRALEEQRKMGQFAEEGLVRLLLPCDERQAELCACARPAPDVFSEKRPLSPALRAVAEAADPAGFWREQLQRCIKCYGCRNACPVCICPECRLEDPDFVPALELPPSPLVWHVCRALHVADKCVQCGACQDVCPSGIPLLAIHHALGDSLRARFAYQAGTGQPSPLYTAALAEGPAGMPAPEWKTCPGACTGEKA